MVNNPTNMNQQYTECIEKLELENLFNPWYTKQLIFQFASDGATYDQIKQLKQIETRDNLDMVYRSKWQGTLKALLPEDERYRLQILWQQLKTTKEDQLIAHQRRLNAARIISQRILENIGKENIELIGIEGSVARNMDVYNSDLDIAVIHNPKCYPDHPRSRKIYHLVQESRETIDLLIKSGVFTETEIEKWKRSICGRIYEICKSVQIELLQHPYDRLVDFRDYSSEAHSFKHGLITLFEKKK